MRILLIEDNPLKRDKVAEFLTGTYNADIREAASFNSGLKAALEGGFDLIILDMSMPTFDRTESSHGGRFRALAGSDIATRLARQDRISPFVVLTGYRDFSVDSQSLSIEDIDQNLKSLGDAYKGCILFDSAESSWKEGLKEIIDGVAK